MKTGMKMPLALRQQALAYINNAGSSFPGCWSFKKAILKDKFTAL